MSRTRTVTAKATSTLALALWLIATTAHAETIRFGIAKEPFPPFTQKNADGQWVGFEIDLMNAICQEMKADCPIVETPWTGIIPALNAGKFDVIWSSMSITPKRMTAIDFSDRVYHLPVVFLGPKSQPINIDFKNPASLNGNIVGMAGVYYRDFVMKYFPSADVRVFDTHARLSFELTTGHLDVAIMDALEADVVLTSTDGSEFAIFATAPRDPLFGLGVGGGFRKSDTDLRQRFNAALQTLHRNGTYDALARRYFDFDPNGG